MIVMPTPEKKLYVKTERWGVTIKKRHMKVM